MNIYYDPQHNTDVTIKMSYQEMLDLHYMLAVSSKQLFDDRMCIMKWGGDPNKDTRLDMNLDLRDLISDTINKHNAYMDEQENI